MRSLRNTATAGDSVELDGRGPRDPGCVEQCDCGIAQPRNDLRNGEPPRDSPARCDSSDAAAQDSSARKGGGCGVPREAELGSRLAQHAVRRLQPGAPDVRRLGVCPGPACQAYEGYWSAQSLMQEHFPNCTAGTPAVWRARAGRVAVEIAAGCSIAAWQQPGAAGAFCPDPNVRPLPCPGLNVSAAVPADGGLKLTTCMQQGRESSGAWTGFDALAGYLDQAAVTNLAACARLPGVVALLHQYVCPGFTPAMAEQAAAFPRNLPVLAVIKQSCAGIAAP